MPEQSNQEENVITQEKLVVYQRYEGDLEGLERVGNEREKSIVTQEELELIERLLRGLKLCNRGLATPEFCAAIEREVRESCDGSSTIVMLVGMMHD
jgi:hypothetical protein